MSYKINFIIIPENIYKGSFPKGAEIISDEDVILLDSGQSGKNFFIKNNSKYISSENIANVTIKYTTPLQTPIIQNQDIILQENSDSKKSIGEKYFDCTTKLENQNIFIKKLQSEKVQLNKKNVNFSLQIQHLKKKITTKDTQIAELTTKYSSFEKINSELEELKNENKNLRKNIIILTEKSKFVESNDVKQIREAYEKNLLEVKKDLEVKIKLIEDLNQKISNDEKILLETKNQNEKILSETNVKINNLNKVIEKLKSDLNQQPQTTIQEDKNDRYNLTIDLSNCNSQLQILNQKLEDQKKVLSEHYQEKINLENKLKEEKKNSELILNDLKSSQNDLKIYKDLSNKSDKSYQEIMTNAEKYAEKIKLEAKNSIDQIQKIYDEKIKNERKEAEEEIKNLKNEADIYSKTVRLDADAYVKNIHDQNILIIKDAEEYSKTIRTDADAYKLKIQIETEEYLKKKGKESLEQNIPVTEIPKTPPKQPPYDFSKITPKQIMIGSAVVISLFIILKYLKTN